MIKNWQIDPDNSERYTFFFKNPIPGSNEFCWFQKSATLQGYISDEELQEVSDMAQVDLMGMLRRENLLKIPMNLIPATALEFQAKTNDDFKSATVSQGNGKNIRQLK